MCSSSSNPFTTNSAFLPVCLSKSLVASFAFETTIEKSIILASITQAFIPWARWSSSSAISSLCTALSFSITFSSLTLNLLISSILSSVMLKFISRFLRELRISVGVLGFTRPSSGFFASSNNSPSKAPCVGAAIPALFSCLLGI